MKTKDAGKPMKLTSAIVVKLQPADKEYSVSDSRLSGLALRVRPSGEKTWTLRGRDGRGKARRITLGKAAHLTPAQAVAMGESAKVALRMERFLKDGRPKKAPTLTQFFEIYLQRHAIPNKRPRSVNEDKGYWNRCLKSSLGALPMNEITQSDVQELISQNQDKPIQANRSLALLRHIFTCWRRWEQNNDDPCRNVSGYRESSRDLYLTEPEVEKLFASANCDLDESAALIIKLAVLTGARASEILGMRWSELSTVDGLLVWTLPSTRTKQGQGNIKGLNAQATALVQDWQQSTQNKVSMWVFPALTQAEKARRFPTKSWQRIRSRAEMPHVHFHDLRHTFASLALKRGAPLALIGKNMGHTRIETTHRYAHLAAKDAQNVSSVLPEILDISVNKI